MKASYIDYRISNLNVPIYRDPVTKECRAGYQTLNASDLSAERALEKFKKKLKKQLEQRSLTGIDCYMTQLILNK
jgi:hypothetical protein